MAEPKADEKDEKAKDSKADEPKAAEASRQSPRVPDSPRSQPVGPGDPDPAHALHTPGPPDNPHGPGKPTDTSLADARLSQPPSPPSLAQASATTRQAVMDQEAASGGLGQVFTLWTRQYQIVPADCVLISEVNPANDPRLVYVVRKALVEEAIRMMQEHRG